VNQKESIFAGGVVVGIGSGSAQLLSLVIEEEFGESREYSLDEM
jgi:hypothetical protein